MSDPLRSAVFARALRRAVSLVGGGGPLGRLLAAAGAMLGHKPGALGGVSRDFGAALRMVHEVMRGHYRVLPRRTLVAVVAATIYLLNPLDLIPDVLPLFGLLDDAVVLTWVVRQVRRDLDAYLAWERELGGAIDVEAREVVSAELLLAPGAPPPGT